MVKNVIAIAAGMAEGMGFGDNTRATMITRGLAEMSRLGIALGADALTFSGLAGMGDLIATCSSSQSRNNSVGRELGKGRPIDEVIAEMRQVAEGVKSSPSVLALARRKGVDMPITEQVVAVCHEGSTAQERPDRADATVDEAGDLRHLVTTIGNVGAIAGAASVSAWGAIEPWDGAGRARLVGRGRRPVAHATRRADASASGGCSGRRCWRRRSGCPTATPCSASTARPTTAA